MDEHLPLYDAAQRTTFTREECDAVIGKRARFTLTGVIVSAGSSDAGHYVVFQPDERWGFDGSFGGDLELFDVDRE